MRQITGRHLEFLEEVKERFKANIKLESWRSKDGDLIALRRGMDRDCIQIIDLGDEVAFFAQAIPPTDGGKLLEAIGKEYDLELSKVRPEVAEFGLEMEKQLIANEFKGGWENCTHTYLIHQVQKNVHGLMNSISHSEFRRRCANIANFAMMLDNVDRREEVERAGRRP